MRPCWSLGVSNPNTGPGPGGQNINARVETGNTALSRWSGGVGTQMLAQRASITYPSLKRSLKKSPLTD